MRAAVHVDEEWSRHEVRRALRLLVEHVAVGVAHQRAVVGVEEDVLGIAPVDGVAAEAEVAHEAVRVGAGERLAVRRPLAVEHRAVALTLDLTHHQIVLQLKHCMTLQFNFANLNVSQTCHAKYAELTSFVKDLIALPERKSQIMMSPS